MVQIIFSTKFMIMNKKSFLVGLSLLMLTFAGYSQPLNIGIKGGLNFTSLGGDAVDANMLVRYHAGAFAKLQITDAYALQPEVLFTAEGAEIDNAGNIKLNYLLVPVLGNFYLTEGFSLNVGPQIGFLLTAKDDGDNDIKDGFKATSLAVALGATYELPVGLSLSARYNLGLNDIGEDNPLFAGNDNITNQVIMLSLGFLLF
jgi:hypothetical protein